MQLEKLTELCCLCHNLSLMPRPYARARTRLP